MSATNKAHRLLETMVERPNFMIYTLQYNNDRPMAIWKIEANVALLILAKSATTASILNLPAYRKLMDENPESFKAYEDIDFQTVGQMT